MTLDEYLEGLASDAPTPGGGSASAIAGALGAALVAMVARITARNTKDAAKRERAGALAAEADALRLAFQTLRIEDEKAFEGVVAAQALPRSTDDERAARTAYLQRALGAACEAPLACARHALDALALTERAGALENRHLMSDVGCAGEFAVAALRGAAYNVRANHPWLADPALTARNERELQALASSGDAALLRIRALTP